METKLLTRRQIGLLIAQTLLGAILLWLWLRVVNLQAVGKILKQANGWLVLAAAGLSVSAGAIRAGRWRQVLRPLLTVPPWELWMINAAAALINFIIPLRTTEIAKSLFLKYRRQVPVAASLPTVAIDRSFDLVAVLTLGIVGGLMGVHLGSRLSLVILAGGGLLLSFIVLIGLALWSQRGLITLLSRLLPKQLNEKWRERILSVGEAFLRGLATAAQRPGDMALMLGLSLVAILSDATGLYLLFFALNIQVSFAVVATGFALLTLSFIVPGAPGYIGSTEAFGLLIFVTLGIERDLAAGAVLLNHAVSSSLIVVLGTIGLWVVRLRPGAKAIPPIAEVTDPNGLA
jgi:glycosyltransferase 2 family protein